jgi:hypothetical protein
MGTPDSRYVSNKDYGRRLYVDDANYNEQMGVGSRRPAFTQNTALYKQSEFKKPYREDSYSEMEYGADPSSGLPPPWPGPPSDNPAPYEGDAPISPWTVRFLCWGDPCYGYGEMHCETITCVWPITGYAAVSAPAGCQYQLNLSGVVCGECPEGETFQIIFDVLMRAKFQHAGATVTVNGRYYGMSMSHCIGSCDDTGIAWDYDVSAETVAREASVSVAISDSLGTRGSPYSWSVSGVGFTLDNATTTGLTNTLNADDTACGSAEITVTGCGGKPVTGYVRCTTGVWLTVFSTTKPYPANFVDKCCNFPCQGPGSGGSHNSYEYFSLIERVHIVGSGNFLVRNCVQGPRPCALIGGIGTVFSSGLAVTMTDVANLKFGPGIYQPYVAGCWSIDFIFQEWGCA